EILRGFSFTAGNNAHQISSKSNVRNQSYAYRNPRFLQKGPKVKKMNEESKFFSNPLNFLKNRTPLSPPEKHSIPKFQVSRTKFTFPVTSGSKHSVGFAQGPMSVLITCGPGMALLLCLTLFP